MPKGTMRVTSRELAERDRQGSWFGHPVDGAESAPLARPWDRRARS